VRWKKDRRLQFSLALFSGRRSALLLPGVATLMPLSCCRIIAADNLCAFGVRAALPELLLI
ncbi:hypothetical protein CQA02_29605, partial [Klebsiella variicola]